jgi:phosphatidylserine decarboxylase
MDSLFIFLQHVVPQHLLSRMMGYLAELRYPLWLKNWVIKQFVAHFRVDMSEAVEADIEAYAHFNAFFTRALKEDARPVADAPIVCPADGAISQLGEIEGGRIFQAKGQYFSTTELLGGDLERAIEFKDGDFATIYLSPRDYHRVHMPIAGTLTATCYIPGKLFSVNGTTAENVDRLFARIVAGIETVWSGQVAPPSTMPHLHDYTAAPESIHLKKGEEMGRFKLGSTVILLFAEDAIKWQEGYQAGTTTRLGEALAVLD